MTLGMQRFKPIFGSVADTLEVFNKFLYCLLGPQLRLIRPHSV